MQEFRVIFTQSAPVTDPAAFVFPVDRRWNDFTFNFRGNVRFEALGRLPLKIQIFVVPFTGSGISKTFASWFDSLSADQRESLQGLDFITLLGAPESYVELRRWCGDESEYLSIIEALRDITWLTKVQRSEAALAARSQEFMLGVLRSGSAYRAFRSGFDAPLVAIPALIDARTSFMFRPAMDGQQVEIHICFKDNAFYEDRVHCLVGKNGVGKSRLLAALVQKVASDRALLNEASAADLLTPVFNRVLVYTTEAEPQFPREFPIESFDYRHFSITERAGGDVETQGAYVGRMLVDLLREREGGAGPPRYGAFKASVEGLIPWELLCIPVFDRVDESLTFLDETGAAWAFYGGLEYVGEQRRLTVVGSVDPDREIGFFRDGHPIRISSGQRTFMRFALHFTSFVSDGALVVIDEPETHLHPNLVSQFMLLLSRMLSRYKSIALIATHSIYVVREVPTYCNHLLSRSQDGGLEIDSVYLPTLGASPTSLSMAIFGDDTAAKVSRQIARKIASDGRSILDLIPELEAVVSSEMLMEIRALLEENNATS